jgi:ribosomal protein S24E
MEIVKEFENKLLKRKEIVAKEKIDGPTITRKEAKEKLAKLVGAEENLIVIKSIKPLFGSNYVEIIANIYDDEKSLKEFSREYLIKRNTFEQQQEEQEA